MQHNKEWAKRLCEERNNQSKLRQRKEAKTGDVSNLQPTSNNNSWVVAHQLTCESKNITLLS